MNFSAFIYRHAQWRLSRSQGETKYMIKVPSVSRQHNDSLLSQVNQSSHEHGDDIINVLGSLNVKHLEMGSLGKEGWKVLVLPQGFDSLSSEHHSYQLDYQAAHV